MKIAELLLQGAAMEFEVDEEGMNSMLTKMASKLLEDSGTLRSVIVYMDLTKTFACRPT